MNKQEIQFAVVTENNVVKQVGRSSIIQPKTNYKGKGTKWFDDDKLLKNRKK